jgi:hypothetical protein
MTIRLLAAYDIYPQNAIVTLAAGTESGLIAAGQATATLTGGGAYVAPAVPPVINNARVKTSGGVSTIIDDAGNTVSSGGGTAVATATTLGLVKGAGIAADGTLVAGVGTTVTATGTLPASALGVTTPVNSAAAVTLTLPSAATAFSANPFGLIVISQLGVGVPTFAAGAGDTLRATSGIPACVQYGMIAAQVISSTEWALA